MGEPLISVVTINKNDAEGLSRTLESVRTQTFPSFEFIVIDGGSSDDSAQRIKKHEDFIDKISIGQDSGIAEGFNRGLRLAEGKWIHFLNAGDTYLTSTSLETVARYLSGECLLTAKVLYRGSPFPSDRIIKSQKLRYKARIHHQGTFVPRVWFQRYGEYDERFKIRMDYEFWLRTLQYERVHSIDEVIVNFEAARSFFNLKNYYLEEMLAERLYFRSWPLLNASSLVRWLGRWVLRKIGFAV